MSQSRVECQTCDSSDHVTLRERDAWIIPAMTANQKFRISIVDDSDIQHPVLQGKCIACGSMCDFETVWHY